MNKRTLFLIQQAGMLMQMPRSHKRNLGNTFDTVASHSHHVAVIAYCLARMEGLSHDDGLKAMAMGVLHDLPEARTGDIDYIAKNYSQTEENRAASDTYTGIEFGSDLENLFSEFNDRQSTVAQCVNDADLVEQMYQEWVLLWQGNKLAEKWFEGKLKLTVPKFYTQSAKDLVLSMKDSNPHEWWWSELVDKNYSSKNLTGR